MLDGKDTFVIMPTGGGKSLCYQLPALMSEGTAIVVSPLIALMKNQVDFINGISSHNSLAHVLNSSLNKTQVRNVKFDILNNKTKLLYVAPESLAKNETIEFLKSVNISLLAIDEAHCISEWGHDFRPDYRNIRTILDTIKAAKGRRMHLAHVQFYGYDNKGKKYLDALCGLAVTSLGHSNPKITEAIKKQSQELIHTSNAFQIDSQEKLAKRLCQLTGMENSFFCNSGAEAVEAAIKIARKYGHDRGHKNPKIVVMSNGFHGRTMGAMSVTSNEVSHLAFGPILEGLVRVKFNDINAIREALTVHKDIAAVLLEPIQGEGGIISCSDDYMRELSEICIAK